MRIEKFKFCKGVNPEENYMLFLSSNDLKELTFIDIPYYDKNIVSFCIINNILKGFNGICTSFQCALPKEKFVISKVDTEKLIVTLELI